MAGAVGSSEVKFNFSEALTVKDLRVERTRTVVQHVTRTQVVNAGGKVKISVTVKFYIPSDRQAFVQLAIQNKDANDKFTFSYTKGPATYLLTGCLAEKDTFGSDQDADVSGDLSFKAEEETQVR